METITQSLLAELQSRYEGVEPAILGKIAEQAAAAATDNADVKSIADSVTFANILKSYGDARAKSAETKAVKDYESRHKIKDGKPLESPQPQSVAIPTTNIKTAANAQAEAMTPESIAAIVAQQLAQAVSPLQEQIAKYEGERTADRRRKKILEVTKTLPDNVRKRYLRDYERMTFDSAEDFEDYATELTADVKAISDDYSRKASVVTPPKASSTAVDTKKVDPLLLQRIAKQQEAQASSAFVGMPARLQPTAGLPTLNNSNNK